MAFLDHHRADVIRFIGNHIPIGCASWLYSFKQENIHLSGTSSVFSEDLYKPPPVLAHFFDIG